MKKVLLFVLGLLFALAAIADTYVNGYYRKDGTYVQGYYRTSPNSTTTDNYSSQGNINPYTGDAGTRANDYTPDAANYGAGQTIYTGPRGRQYYINDYGRKVYVPKQ
jgi:Ni/Co efflux regulator RcnB